MSNWMSFMSNWVLEKGGELKLHENDIVDYFRNIGWKENYENETSLWVYNVETWSDGYT